MIEEIDSYLVAAVRDVFATMMEWQLEDPGPYGGIAAPGQIELRGINGTIGFGGKLTGSIFFSCDERQAEEMTKKILGGDTAIGAQEISDVVAEITNMLAGGVKSRLSDKNFSVAMSIPNVIRGRHVCATTKGISFMLKRRFVIPQINENFQVAIVGKFE